MKNKVMKVITKSMREMTEEGLTCVGTCPSGMFRQVRTPNNNSKEDQGGNSMKSFNRNARSRLDR